MTDLSSGETYDPVMASMHEISNLDGFMLGLTPEEVDLILKDQEVNGYHPSSEGQSKGDVDEQLLADRLGLL